VDCLVEETSAPWLTHLSYVAITSAFLGRHFRFSPLLGERFGFSLPNVLISLVVSFGLICVLGLIWYDAHVYAIDYVFKSLLRGKIFIDPSENIEGLVLGWIAPTLISIWAQQLSRQLSRSESMK